jgi:hypothetical protein
MDKVKVYLHNDYNHKEMEEEYKVKGKQLEELFDAIYEVELVYDFDTHKLSPPEKSVS